MPFRHIQGNHGGQLNFLQPGFLIASLDDRPLHTVGAKRTSFQSMVIPSLSNVEQDCSRGAVGGFDPRFSEEQSNGNKADIIFMKPVGRVMNNAECASSNHRGQPSLVSSKADSKSNYFAFMHFQVSISPTISDIHFVTKSLHTSSILKIFRIFNYDYKSFCRNPLFGACVSSYS